MNQPEVCRLCGTIIYTTQLLTPAGEHLACTLRKQPMAGPHSGQ